MPSDSSLSKSTPISISYKILFWSTKTTFCTHQILLLKFASNSFFYPYSRSFKLSPTLIYPFSQVIFPSQLSFPGIGSFLTCPEDLTKPGKSIDRLYFSSIWIIDWHILRTMWICMLFRFILKTSWSFYSSLNLISSGSCALISAMSDSNLLQIRRIAWFPQTIFMMYQLPTFKKSLCFMTSILRLIVSSKFIIERINYWIKYNRTLKGEKI